MDQHPTQQLPSGMSKVRCLPLNRLCIICIQICIRLCLWAEAECSERGNEKVGKGRVTQGPWPCCFHSHSVSSFWVLKSTNWSSSLGYKWSWRWIPVTLRARQMNPCSIPFLIWMWHLQATACRIVRIISPLKCRSWSFAQKGQLKILLSGAFVTRDLVATFLTPHPTG